MPRYPFQFIELPAERSRTKPRRRGLTMMIDDGIPLGYQKDVLALCADYIDLAKIKTGSARLYPEPLLRRKLAQYRAKKVQPFIGGQFHEYVFATEGEKGLPRFYSEALRLGFAALEISDNVVPLTKAQRQRQIRMAADAGLTVFGEVGSKDTASNPSLLVKQAEDCFAAGAALVLVEAADIFPGGKANLKAVRVLSKGLDMAKVMIELPGPWIPEVRACDIEKLKKVLIEEFGPDVNLANVAPPTVLDLETTRVGLGVAGPPKRALDRASR